MPNVALQISDKYPIMHLTRKRIAKFRSATVGESLRLSTQKYLGFGIGRRRVDLRDAMTGLEAIEKDKKRTQEEFGGDMNDGNGFGDEEDTDGEDWKR